jgi:Xaa-Pro dipeptidase
MTDATTNRLGAREQALWDAQLRAEALFNRVVECNLIRPGCSESELSDAIFALGRREFNIARHWHRRIVRSGPNTLLTYDDEPPDRLIANDDILFFDFGPVFDGWEADLGRSYVVGDDPDKLRLVENITAAFRSGQALYESYLALTAGELYDHVAALAIADGWSFGSTTAGHPVDAFPHQKPGAARYAIEHASAVSLRAPLPDGRPRHWILEIHFVDRERGYGAFCEELLTVRGPR